MRQGTQIECQATPDLILWGPTRAGTAVAFVVAVCMILPFGVWITTFASSHFGLISLCCLAACAGITFGARRLINRYEFRFRERDRLILISTVWFTLTVRTHRLSFEAVRSIEFNPTPDGCRGLEMVTIDGDRWILSDIQGSELPKLAARVGALMGKRTVDQRHWTGPW